MMDFENSITREEQVIENVDIHCCIVLSLETLYVTCLCAETTFTNNDYKHVHITFNLGTIRDLLIYCGLCCMQLNHLI